MVADPRLPYLVQGFEVNDGQAVIQYVDPAKVRPGFQSGSVLQFNPRRDEEIEARIAELLADLCALIDAVEGGGGG